MSRVQGGAEGSASRLAPVTGRTRPRSVVLADSDREGLGDGDDSGEEAGHRPRAPQDPDNPTSPPPHDHHALAPHPPRVEVDKDGARSSEGRRDAVVARQVVDRSLHQLGRKEVPRAQAGMQGAAEEQTQQNARAHLAANPLRLSTLPAQDKDSNAQGPRSESAQHSGVTPRVAEERVRAVLTQRRDLANAVMRRLMTKRGEPVRDLAVLTPYTLSTPSENKPLLRSILARASRRLDPGQAQSGGSVGGGDANERYAALASASLSLVGEEPNPLNLDWVALHQLLPSQ